MNIEEVIAVGVDAVDLKRWARSELSTAVDFDVFHGHEFDYDPTQRACCWAIKEAVLKCLELDVLLVDLGCIRTELHRESGAGPCSVSLSGRSARRASEMNISHWMVDCFFHEYSVIAIVVARGAAKAERAMCRATS